MDPRQQYTTQQKLMLLRSRFKSKKDMWVYMSERRKYPLSLAGIRARAPRSSGYRRTALSVDPPLVAESGIC